MEKDSDKNLISLYKYYSAEIGLKVLSENKILWSTSKRFNDPFDNQFDFQFEEPFDEVHKEEIKFLQAFFNGDNSIIENFNPDIKEVLLKLKQNTDENTQKILINILQKEPAMTEEYLKFLINLFNKGIREAMKTVSIFCLSETFDNLLMWAHYADNHKGMVINFKDYPEADSPIKMAQKVCYSDKLPTFKTSDILLKRISVKQIREIFTLTKSRDWEYEKEWRIVGGLRNPLKECEIISFAPQEIKKIYLGCKMSQNDIEKTINIIKEKYNWVEIFLAKKSKTKYKLEFEKLQL